MAGKSILRISPADLDNLMNTLEVNFVKLAECLVSPGWRLELPASDAPGIHYNLGGIGKMIIGDQPPLDLLPHTLVIVPAGQAFRIEVLADDDAAPALMIVESRWQTFAPGVTRRFLAGAGEPKIMLICGYFRATYGASIDLFSALTTPIIEQFDAGDRLDHKLTAALAELVAQEIGMGAMATALLKQVLVALLRRSLSSINQWVEQFPILTDPHIARAFADMVAQPGAAHSVQSLAQSACLSRSAFMARFTSLFGRAPMVALREMRMRQAAILLTANTLSIDQIAQGAGYASRSSFLRAFRKAYGSDPSDYRAAARRPLEQRLPAAYEIGENL